MRDEALSRIDAGESPAAVAMDLGVSRDAVYRWICEEYSPEMHAGRGGYYSDDDRKSALSLAEAGLSNRKIANRLGIGESTVRRWRSGL